MNEASGVELDGRSDRDRKAYELARKYLLETGGAAGVTQELLDHYLHPIPVTQMPDLFYRLLESAQNRNMMASVIGGALGGLESLRPILSQFDPAAVVQSYDSAEQLLDIIKRKLHLVGKVRNEPGSLWPLFARAVLSGAQFLAQFNSASDFLEWVRVFDEDDRKREALPLLISSKIAGFGFALACDFLKEIGFVKFAKPDVHVKAIVTGLRLSTNGRADAEVFAAVARIARHCGTTPYNVDKLFWLVGSGYFYDHRELGRNGRIGTNRDAFIAKASTVLGGAA